MGKTITIVHRPSGELIAEGPRGWGITPFEGNYYIGRKWLKTAGFKPNFIPGLCFYKFLYTWMDFTTSTGQRSRGLGWMYWFPNPLFPFIWFRVAVPGRHPDLQVVESDIVRASTSNKNPDIAYRNEYGSYETDLGSNSRAGSDPDESQLTAGPEQEYGSRLQTR